MQIKGMPSGLPPSAAAPPAALPRNRASGVRTRRSCAPCTLPLSIRGTTRSTARWVAGWVGLVGLGVMCRVG